MTLFSDMTAIAISSPGGPEVLKPARIAVPKPGEGEVLVKVAAAGVNRPDVLQRMGAYAPPPGAPLTPGLEISGVVVATGPGTKRYKTGDKVCALVPGGGYAEYCSAAEANALPMPVGLTIIEAGAIPETFFTVWTNVFDRAALKPGESLLVHGGSSGIGTTAIMLGAAFGSTVYTTAGSPEKCAACVALGARRAINYRSEDFAAVITAETGGKGVDVILDMVGGDYYPRNLASAAVHGRIISIAHLQGAKAEINIATVMQKRLTLTGSTLRPRSIAEKSVIARALEEKVWPLLAAGKVKPQIYRTFPLAEAAAAHALMESSAHVGKIVLVP